jgi:hypothetical protein
MRRLGREARGPARVYLTGGASAVLRGWRPGTIDVDLKLDPDRDEILRAIPGIKEDLEVNIELASPDDFIPELPGWRERSPFITREGQLDFHDYDFYAQALSKLERRHRRDLEDVAQMHRNGLIEPRRLAALFDAIEPQLYRYPALDPPRFRRAVEEWIARVTST